MICQHCQQNEIEWIDEYCQECWEKEADHNWWDMVASIDWFVLEDIAGFQTHPNYRVVFKSDRPSLSISKEQYEKAAQALGMTP